MVKNPARRKFFSKPLLAVLVLTLLVGGTFAYRATRTAPSEDSRDTSAQTKTPETTPTYEATTGGETVTVPKDVPPESIRDYHLVTENEQYKIRYNGSSYLITLYAIINNPSQYDTYRDQLREYKQKALNYLKNTGVDVTKVRIDYEPKEAEEL